MAGLRSGVLCFDRIFDKACSEKYFLSIRLEPDGFFYAVFDTEIQKYIGMESSLQSGTAELYDFISKHEILRKKFCKTVCIVPSNQYTLVPNALYAPKKKEEYLSFIFNVHPGSQISTSDVTSEDAKLIYATSMAYNQIAQDFFPSAVILSRAAALINYVLPRFRNRPSSLMFINLYRDEFDLLVLENGKMIFCNNYTYKAPEDLVYYTLFVMDQLSINPEKAEVNMSGNISIKSDLLKLLRKYIRFVSILKYDGGSQLSYAFSEVEPHRFIDLLNPALCE